MSSLIAANSDCAQAEIVPDDTLGNESSVVTPLTPNLDSIDGGAIRGTNLFHSFEKFNIDAGRRALFRNPNGIENIISRVRGGSRSEILGTLGVLGSANLFLINPNGIIFGPNSKLALGGSFVGTTANAIRFGDIGFFSASTPDAPPLLTVKPSALLFNQIANQPINIQSSAGLKLPANRSLLLVGGDVNLSGGLLRTQGGRIELGGLAGAGTVELNVDGNNLRLSFPDSIALANVSLTNGATVETDFGLGTTSGLGRGGIQVQGKRVTLSDNSEISASTFGSQPGGTLTVNADLSVEVTGKSRLLAETEGSGKGGELIIKTQKLIVRDGSYIAAGAFREGEGGKLTIKASEVELSGTSNDGKDFSSILTQSDGAGNAGDLTIEAKRLTLRDGARVSTATTASGSGGKLVITDSDSVELTGTSTSVDNPIPSGLSASAEGSGKPGELTIETKKLIIQDGARAFTSNLGTATDGGTLTVKASESVELSGTSTNGEDRSGLLVGTEGIGVGGELRIETPSLQVQNGAIVSARTVGEGQGGTVIINASDSVELIGTSDDMQKFSILTTETRGRGEAGKLIVKTGQLSIKNGAQITSSSIGEGSAGNTQIQAESISLDQGNIISQTASGDGGNIDLSVKDLLLLRRNSQISTTAGTAQAGGDGGNIFINAENGFIVALPDEDSDITANAFSGQGGQVNIEAAGIFGIAPLSREDLARILETDDPDELDSTKLLTNDITAISQQNPNLSGELNINTPDNDSLSPEELPIDIVDVSGLVEENLCEASQDSEFIITGRGGIPPDPTEALEADAGWEDWRIFSDNRSNMRQGVRKTLPKVNGDRFYKKNRPLEIVPAQGWIVGSNGNVLLTAYSPKANPHTSTLNNLNCHSFSN